MKTIIHICLPVLLAFAPLTAYAQNSTYTTASEEPSRGTGKVVGGILLTSIGSAVGLLVFYVGMSMRTCYSDDADDCDSDNRAANDLMNGGLVVTGASLGGGIPLIVSGARDRKEWKTWKRQQIHEGEARRPPSTLNLGFKHEGQGGAATLTFGY